MGRDLQRGLAAIGSGLDSLSQGYKEGEDREWLRKKRTQEEELWPLQKEQAKQTVQQGQIKTQDMAEQLALEHDWYRKNGIDPQKLFQEMTFTGAMAKTPEAMEANKGQDVPVPNILAFNNAFPGNPQINSLKVGEGGGFVAQGTDPKTGQSTSWPVMPDEIKRAIVFAGPKATMQFYGGIMKQQMAGQAAMDRGVATTKMRLDAEAPERQARTEQAQAGTGLRIAQTQNAEKGRSDYDQRYQQLLEMGMSPDEAMDRASGADVKREGLDIRRSTQNDRQSQYAVQGAEASIRSTLRKYAPQEAANVGAMTSEQLMAMLMSGKSQGMAELSKRAQAGDNEARQDMEQFNGDVSLIQEISRDRANQYRAGQGQMQQSSPAAGTQAPSPAGVSPRPIYGPVGGGANRQGAPASPQTPPQASPTQPQAGGITDARTGRYIPEGTVLPRKDGSKWIVRGGKLVPAQE